MAVKAIFFDLYGTLYKYGNMQLAWDDWLYSLFIIFNEYDNNLTIESLSLKCEGFFSKDDPQLEDSDLSIFERRIKQLSKELNYSIPDEKIKLTAKNNLTAWQKHITLDIQTLPLLKLLKNDFIMGIISNFDHPDHVRNL